MGFLALVSEGDTANVSPYVTDAFSPADDALIVACVLPSGTNVATPTLTGFGLTWDLIAGPVNVESSSRKLFIYAAQAVGDPGTDSLTISVSTVPTGCSWSVIEVTGHNLSSLDLFPQVVTQINPGVSQTITLTFAVPADPANRQIIMVGVSSQNTNNTITPQVGWVQDAEVVRSTPSVKLFTAHQPTAFDSPVTTTEDDTYEMSGIGIEIDFSSAGGITEPFGTSNETETAIPLGKLKVKSSDVSVETETALLLTRSKAKTSAISQEVETALALARTRSRTPTTAQETETALPLGRAKAKSFGIAQEVETAIPTTSPGEIVQPFGTAQEVETGLPLGRVKAKSFGIAIETETSLPLNRVKSKLLGVAQEIETALPLGDIELFGVAQETETALPLNRLKSKSFGVAQEVESAIPTVQAGEIVSDFGTAQESETALAVGRVKSKPFGIAQEVESTLAVSVPGEIIVSFGVAIEVESALAVSHTKAKNFARVEEIETGPALARVRSRGFDIAQEVESGTVLTRVKSREFGVGTETETALPRVGSKFKPFGVSQEIETALEIFREIQESIFGPTSITLDSGGTSSDVLGVDTFVNVVASSTSVTLGSGGPTSVTLEGE